MEKLRRNETANVMVNSKSFEDPGEVAEKEAERLKDIPSVPGDSMLNYPD